MADGLATSDATVDLLGSPRGSTSDLYVPDSGSLETGKTVDLSGKGGLKLPSPSTVVWPSSSSGSVAFGGGSSASSASPSEARGPSSIESRGARSGLSSLNPTDIVRQLASRPLTELVREHGPHFIQLPRYAARAYSAAARRYLRPWTEFLHLRPGRIIEGFRRAHSRGEIQVYVQRNVVVNARRFCPNYVFMFMVMLFWFVCTSPMLLGMLSLVGGGWSHALRNDSFKSRPWQLQIGGASVPLGSNVKMLIMALPTLLFLHMFMGPVLWSAALCSGGVSLAHASLRDREDDLDDENHGLGSELP